MARKYSKAASEKVERTMHAHKQATLGSASGKGEKQEAGDCNRTFRSTQGGQKGAGKKEGGEVQMTTRTPKPVSPQQSLQCLSGRLRTPLGKCVIEKQVTTRFSLLSA